MYLVYLYNSFTIFLAGLISIQAGNFNEFSILEEILGWEFRSLCSVIVALQTQNSSEMKQEKWADAILQPNTFQL